MQSIYYWSVAFICLCGFDLYSQNNSAYLIRTVAFYNVENLFDTIDHPDTFDDAYTPSGKYKWNSISYKDKIRKISKVIGQIGKETSGSPPDIIGLAEIENKAVLDDITKELRKAGVVYRIVHQDSKDPRGIDVALLYKEDCFIVSAFKSYPLELLNEAGYSYHSRDLLVVCGYLDGEEVFLIINHWPSRRGGILKNEHKRIKAARLNKKIIDSILKTDIQARIISMGDFNDNPTDRSIRKILQVRGKKELRNSPFLFNPMEKLYKKGYGSLAYRDTWNLFDQIFLSSSLLVKDEGYRYWKAGIFNKLWLRTASGRYKGYPLRGYTHGSYTGGYSDHFPVYIYLIRKTE
nr:endonuclease/exonuclease/phosphatase family protein [Leptobacterium flavescens]